MHVWVIQIENKHDHKTDVFRIVRELEDRQYSHLSSTWGIKPHRGKHFRLSTVRLSSK